MKFHHRYRRTPALKYKSDQPSLTRQSEADSCDINTIMERFNRTGVLPTGRVSPPRYGDAIVPDYQTAMTVIKDAHNAFAELPAATRKYFLNDPAEFLRQTENPTPDQVDHFLKLGIAIHREESPTDTLREIAKNTRPEKVAKKPGNSDPT